MRLLLNLVLILIIGGLAYMLIHNISEPIAFQAEKNKREKQVVNRLMDIRTSQEIYKSITGKFANNFDSLIHVLKTQDIPQYKVIGDPDDENAEFVVETLYFNAFDSITALGITLDSIRYIPFGNSKEFNIDADTLTYQQTLVNVVEVGVQKADYMGKFADPKFAKYDKAYNPMALLKFGNLNSPNLSGNWE